MPLDVDILGSGIYTPREAARLVRTTPQNVLRWTRGSGATASLWDAHYQFLDDTTEISFVDLVELRVVRAFRAAGVSLQAIRYAIEIAEAKYGVKRPLSSAKFKTDGDEILMEAVEKDGNLVSLSSKRPGQKVFTSIIKQSLNDLEYEDGKSVRWRPHEATNVVVDPRRAFGAPILDDFGIQTGTLYAEYKDFEDISYLSKCYEIPISQIRSAVSFEKSLDSVHAEEST